MAHVFDTLDMNTIATIVDKETLDVFEKLIKNDNDKTCDLLEIILTGNCMAARNIVRRLLIGGDAITSPHFIDVINNFGSEQNEYSISRFWLTRHFLDPILYPVERLRLQYLQIEADARQMQECLKVVNASILQESNSAHDLNYREIYDEEMKQKMKLIEVMSSQKQRHKEKLNKALLSSDVAVRYVAINCILACSGSVVEFVGNLKDAVINMIEEGKDKETLILALMAIGRAGRAASHVLPVVRRAVEISDFDIRFEAVATCIKLGDRDPVYKKILEAGLCADNATVRWEAVVCCVTLKNEARWSLKRLEELSRNDEFALIREYAGVAISKIDGNLD